MKKLTILLVFLSFLNLIGYAEITDDFVEKTLDKNSKIKENHYNPIYDDFAEKNQNKNTINKIKADYNEILPQVKEKRKKTEVIDYTNVQPVKIQIKKYYTTRSKLQEGDYIEFKTAEAVKIKDKNYPKGTTVKARIETISQNKSMGIPADLVVGSFKIEDNSLLGEINKTGANRMLWVYPLSFGTIGLFGIGLLFMPIRGGHAKIRPSQVYTIYTD